MPFTNIILSTNCNFVAHIYNRMKASRLLFFIFAITAFYSRMQAQEADTLASETSKFKLFTPLTFSRTAVNNVFDFNKPAYADAANSDDYAEQALMNIYLKRPDLVKVTDADLTDVQSVPTKIVKPVENKAEIVDKKIDVVDDIVTDEPTAIVVEKPNFWTIKGDYNLQFLQNYISPNWHKGGESSYSFVASGTLEANYNNKQKITWDNKLEARLGFQNTRTDSLHKFKSSEDLLRLTSKLGIQASKKWYYTFQLLVYTQFTTGFKSNDPVVYSDFCSPLNINPSIGMQYKVDALKGKLTGSVLLAPLAYNFRYVGRLSLATKNGLKEGHHTLHDFGSSVTADITWVLAENIKWKSRLYAFTSYRRVEAEWENTFSFAFNTYISTNIFIYPRFDDSYKSRHDDFGYFQLKEYASLGFTYSF